MRPISNTAVNSDLDKDLEALRLNCPKATACERQRFLNAKDGNLTKALAQLSAYLEWRKEHGLDDIYHCSKTYMEVEEHSVDLTLGSSDSDDENDEAIETDIWHSCASNEECLDELDWKFASQAAIFHEQKSNGKRTAKSPTSHTLPQLARILPPASRSGSSIPRDQSGNRILQFLPAMMDLSRASDKAFALSIALYLERKLDRDSQEKILVAIDVRGGSGWANPRPQKLLPFIKQVAGVLEQNFPERLARCLVFPVPAAATFLYRVVKVFLDPSTVQKVALVKGDSRNEAPPPYSLMEGHIRQSVLKHMEDFRVAGFVVETDALSDKVNKESLSSQSIDTR